MFAKIVPLALGAAVSPAVLLITLDLLATAGDARRRLVGAYLLGSVAIPFFLGLVGLFASAILFRQYPYETAASDAFDIGLGVILVGLAVRLLLSKPDPSRHTDLAALRPAKLIGLGFAEMATNFSTLLIEIAGIREIVHARAPVSAGLFATLLLLAGCVAPIWIPLAMEAIAPRPLHRLLVPLANFAGRYGRQVGAAVSGLTGLYLLSRGINLF